MKLKHIKNTLLNPYEDELLYLSPYTDDKINTIDLIISDDINRLLLVKYANLNNVLKNIWMFPSIVIKDWDKQDTFHHKIAYHLSNLIQGTPVEITYIGKQKKINKTESFLYLCKYKSKNIKNTIKKNMDYAHIGWINSKSIHQVVPRKLFKMAYELF